MKAIIIIAIFFNAILLSCHKESNYILKPINNISACSAQDPLNELSWLHDLAVKSINDKSGNYTGTIWIKKYLGQDLIVTDMMLGSGGVLYHVYDCKGNPFTITDISFYNSLTDKDKLFTSNLK